MRKLVRQSGDDGRPSRWCCPGGNRESRKRAGLGNYKNRVCPTNGILVAMKRMEQKHPEFRNKEVRKTI